MRIFVYGTLKRGYALHDAYLRDCPLVGIATVTGFALTGIGIPYLRPAEGCTVAGEVYEVNDPDLIRALDRVEGAYDRQKHPVYYTGGRGGRGMAWMYVARHGFVTDHTFSKKWLRDDGIFDYNEPSAQLRLDSERALRYRGLLEE